jgi:hypothetical protein
MKQIYTGRFTYFTFFKWHSIFITALVESFARVARAFKKNWITLYNIKRWNGLVTSRPSCFWCTKHILACLIPNTNFILIHARADALGKTVVDLKTLIPKVEVEDVKKSGITCDLNFCMNTTKCLPANILEWEQRTCMSNQCGGMKSCNFYYLIYVQESPLVRYHHKT